MHTRLPRLTSPRLIFLTGVAFGAVGVVCLYLSDAVARTGSWWQGTLDALGVGFVVGGIVDVTTISLLNRIITGPGQVERDRNRAGASLLKRYERYADDTSERRWDYATEGLIEIERFLGDPAPVGLDMRQRLIDLSSRLEDFAHNPRRAVE